MQKNFFMSRYTAPGDEEKVKLAKLGGTEWQRTRATVKKATAEMAQELLELYARRRQATGDVYKRQDQNALLHLAGLDHLLSLFGGEDDLAAGRTGRSCQTLADDLSSLQGSCVELGMQQGIQLLGLHAQDSLLLGDQNRKKAK